MPKFDLQLPTIQNWSCHNCGGCCRQHLIAITEDEKQRIDRQSWTVKDGISESVAVVEKNPDSKTRPWRLGHQSDGACVFLQDDGLCRIHAKFGEDAKPLACRLYPYAFHPMGNKITVGLRYSCPSVVANKGTAVADQLGDLKKYAKAVVPDHYKQTPPPNMTPKESSLDWSDILKVVSSLDDAFKDEETPFTLQLLRTVSWVNLLSQSSFEKIQGTRINDLLELLIAAAEMEWEELPTEAERISRIGRVMFRLMISVYGRKETQQELDSPWKSRLLSLKATTKFAWGGGQTPELYEMLPPVSFAEIENFDCGLPEGFDELFRRYVRMKIQGMHFCGAAYYFYPVTTGFFSLALMVPVTLWLARWIAIGQDHDRVTQDDLELAMAIADHHHGYSPVLGLSPFRKRVEYLESFGDIPRLILNYAR
ncbi:MAG: YkgJ family cysteine cluster protein [Planctomycetaceae bacterium]|nr:YkgJ family cysteine cluster protein [Planctomycetaceae bacterium]